MLDLNGSIFKDGFTFPKDLSVNSNMDLEEKVIQFGEGNFLRGFCDYMIDEMNNKGFFGGSIVVVQPIKNGLIDIINKQDGLYTLLLRGSKNGNSVCEKYLISSISRAINPFENFESYLSLAENDNFRVIISNTTEAGIAFSRHDKFDNILEATFPAKLTRLLYERFVIKNGDVKKGFIIIPCELIDNNGTNLKNAVLNYIQLWNLGEAFLSWVNEANTFTNTLVDRIVTGYPKDEANDICRQLGYKDSLIDTAELFGFWVIEGPKWLEEELPFAKAGMPVIFTDDATNYKMRKVRILNGAHTMTVLGAYLSGKDTVGECMENEVIVRYMKKGLFDEVIPTLDLPIEELNSFADSVFERFSNPYIKHYLLNISLNSNSKFKARVLPSIVEYVARKNQLPKILTFSFAALVAFYRGDMIEDGFLIGNRQTNSYNISDDLPILELYKQLWADFDGTLKSATDLVENLCSHEEIWGTDLNEIPNFSHVVGEYLFDIIKNGAMNAMEKIIL